MAGTVQDFTYDLQVDDLLPSTRHHLALLLLDTLGVGAAARDLVAGRAARDVAVALHGAGPGAPAARLAFDGRPVSPAGAAFALAAQTDNLDAHDGYSPSKGHIGVVVVPTLVAHAQARPALTVGAALAALAVGYEVAARAGVALHATVADYHTSGAWNALGAAALAARLDGLEPALLREALGIAEYHGPRSQMMRGIRHPTMVHDGAGWGALAGSSAVALAAAGFTGAPAITVEDPALAATWGDLGDRWTVDDTYVKTYPVCRWTHPMVDAALALRHAHALDHASIAAIEIGTFEEATHLVSTVPASTTDAQYASSFPVAAALVHGRVGVGEVSGAGLVDPAVARLVARTTVVRRPEFDRRFPAERLGDVTITTTSGATWSSGPSLATGGVAEPGADAVVREKFHRLAGPALGAARAAAIEGAATGPLDAPFTDLLALLLPA
ncbi:MmgE/PrpD family protein [soil metagenome]